MGGFEDHQAAATRLYSMVSLAIVPLQFAVIGESTLVLLTLVMGSFFLKFSAVLPDVDSHRSIPRALLGRLITVVLVAAVLISSLELVVPAGSQLVRLDYLSAEQQALLLALMFLVWNGMSSRHRSLTHSLTWAAVVAIGIGALGYTVFSHLGIQLAVAFGGGLAVYTFTGSFSHLYLDDETQILWTRDSRQFTGYLRHIERTGGDFTLVSLVVVCCGLVFVQSSLVLLSVLVIGYPLLLVGRTLPDIDRKRTQPRRVFDLSVSVLLGVTFLLPLSTAVYGSTYAIQIPLQPATLVALLIVLTVLWIGRNSEPETVTNHPIWSVAVVGSVCLLAYTTTSLLPVAESMVVTVGTGGYLALGLYYRSGANTTG